jgi:hypothetical protein
MGSKILLIEVASFEFIRASTKNLLHSIKIGSNIRFCSINQFGLTKSGADLIRLKGDRIGFVMALPVIGLAIAVLETAAANNK